LTWTSFSDDFDEFDDIQELSDAAFRLHVAMLIACSRKLSDGWVSSRMIRVYAVEHRKEDKRDELAEAVTQLVARGVWEAALRDAGEEALPDALPDALHNALRNGPFQIPAYLKTNDSREKVLRNKDLSRKRQQRHRDKKRDTVRDTTHYATDSLTVPLPSPPLPSPTLPKRDQEQSSGDIVDNFVDNLLVTQPKSINRSFLAIVEAKPDVEIALLQEINHLGRHQITAPWNEHPVKAIQKALPTALAQTAKYIHEVNEPVPYLLRTLSGLLQKIATTNNTPREDRE